MLSFDNDTPATSSKDLTDISEFGVNNSRLYSNRNTMQKGRPTNVLLCPGTISLPSRSELSNKHRAAPSVLAGTLKNFFVPFPIRRRGADIARHPHSYLAPEGKN